MSWFTKHSDKPLESEEYKKLSIQIHDIDLKLQSLISRLNIMETETNNLRGKFNRKLKGLSEDEKESVKDSFSPFPKDLNSSPVPGNTIGKLF